MENLIHTKNSPCNTNNQAIIIRKEYVQQSTVSVILALVSRIWLLLLNLSAESTRTCTAKWKPQLLLFQSDLAGITRRGAARWRTFRTTATLMFIFWQMWLNTLQVPFWCYAACYIVEAWSSVVPPAVWIFFYYYYCWYIMSILAYWCSQFTVVSTHCWRLSVTNSCCMFFITFKCIYIQTWQWREINIFLLLVWF